MTGCSLFVPTVRGSSVCSVCRKDISSHTPSSVFYAPSEKIYGSINLSRRRRRPPMKPVSPVVQPSATSAFSHYKRQHSVEQSSASSLDSQSSPDTGSSTDAHLALSALPAAIYVPLSPQVVRPKAVRASAFLPRQLSAEPIRHSSPREHEANLPQEDHSDSSVIMRKIRGKERSRYDRNSIADFGSARSPSPTTLGPGSTREVPPRANNFKQLLTRFQSDERAPTLSLQSADRMPTDRRSPRRHTLDAATHQANLKELMAPHSRELGTDKVVIRRRGDSAFSPVRRPQDPGPRNEEAALIYTQQTILDRSSGSSFGRDPSPLSHTGSTPPPEAPKPPPLTVTIPTPKSRRSISARWVKETDIDDPASLPLSPPNGTFSPDPASSSETPPSPPRSAPSFDDVRVKNGFPARRVFSDNESVDSSKPATPSSHYVRRSRSRNGQSPALSPLRNGNSGSRSSICMIHPIQLETASVSSSQRGRGTPDTHTRSKDTETVYQQMIAANMSTLAYVADNFKQPHEVLDAARLEQLDFKDFILKSTSPTLIKGSCVFYDAVLPRHGQRDLDVTLMISPSSQYGPLRKKNAENGVPALVEFEDHDGAVARFLRDTGRSTTRNPRVVVMQRQNLFSFHSLAAHNLHKSMPIESHECHVAVILTQLLAALRAIQSDNVEHLSNNFKEFLLAYKETVFHSGITDISEHPKLIFLSETLGGDIDETENEYVGLCRYALRVLCTLLHFKMDGRAPPIPNRSRFSRALLACARELEADRSSSLTRAKNILEIALYAPNERLDTEYNAKLYLDAQRADSVALIVRRLIDRPSKWSLSEQLRIAFLLSVNPRSLQLASHTLTNTHF